MAEPSAFSVRPRAAIEFLRQKLRVPSEAWTDIWQEANARAFTVAGANKAALVADFHEAVTRALENGSTLETFRKDFDAIVARHGWSYRGNREWRSQVIYQTNMSMAYSAGQWQGIQRVKDSRPYIGYFAVMDGRTREKHRHWHHIVLPVDHPFWLTHFPPNGWNCRCWTVSLSERDLKRYKLKVSDDPLIVMENRTIKTPDGDVRVDVPRGIDPGFAYNPGRAAFGGGADLAAMQEHGRFSDIVPPGGLRSDLEQIITPRVSTTQPFDLAETADDVRDQLRSVLGGRTGDFLDPLGQNVRVTDVLADHILSKIDGDGATVWQREKRNRYFPFIPELIEQPEEIWVGFAVDHQTGRVVLRRRYISVIMTEKDQLLTIITDFDNGRAAAVTFFNGRVGQMRRQRLGARLYKAGLSN